MPDHDYIVAACSRPQEVLKNQNICQTHITPAQHPPASPPGTKQNSWGYRESRTYVAKAIDRNETGNQPQPPLKVLHQNTKLPVASLQSLARHEDEQTQ